MRKIFFIVISTLAYFQFLPAQPRSYTIREMKWGIDYKLRLELANDSVYEIKIDELYQTSQDETISGDVYFPVGLNVEYIMTFRNATAVMNDESTYDNLFRAVNAITGGTWTHFLNCMLYTLETGQLDLRSPQMIKPVSHWRPDPPTDSYLRTKNWKYYVPVEYKHAKKEYEYRIKNNKTAELDGIPKEYIDLFLKTSPRKLKKMKKTGNFESLAKIDLVKLMLGSNFLKKEQIEYIRNCILTAISEYKIYELPSVIIFTNFKAAVAMSLGITGYKIEGIVFSETEKIDQAEKDRRTNEIQKIIQEINDANQRAIEKKIKKNFE